MKFYAYVWSSFRSSAAYRLCTMLALNGLDWIPSPVQMVRNGGEHHTPAYRAVHPQDLIPTLDDGAIVTQSIAIFEYLEENHPAPALLPREPRHLAYVRSVMSAIVGETNALNNLRVRHADNGGCSCPPRP